jgi:hypothetical protein
MLGKMAVCHGPSGASGNCTGCSCTPPQEKESGWEEMAEYLGSPRAEAMPDSERLLRLIKVAQQARTAIETAVKKERAEHEILVNTILSTKNNEIETAIKNREREIIEKTRTEEETVKEFIVRILSEYHRNALEGKGYDFYFVLRSELDKLTHSL